MICLIRLIRLIFVLFRFISSSFRLHFDRFYFNFYNE